MCRRAPQFQGGAADYLLELSCLVALLSLVSLSVILFEIFLFKNPVDFFRVIGQVRECHGNVLRHG